MRYVDAHCHLDQFPDPEAVTGACEASETYTIAVTNLPSAFANTQHIVRGRAFVRAAAGLHPQLVPRYPYALDQLLAIIENTKYVGEVGLDYSRATTADRQLQRRVLEQVLEHCEALGGRVITVHSRRAAEDVVDLAGGATRSSVILHWFSGSTKTATRAFPRCFFSVNPGMVRTEGGRSLVRAIPDNRLLTETDGPFVRYGGRVIHPFEVASFLPVIAKLRGVTQGELGTIVLKNLRRAVTLGS